MYLTNFIFQPTPSPALHDSSLTLDAIVQGLYEDFWGHFTALSMPRGDGERPDTLEVLSKLSGPVLDLTTFTWTSRISSLSRPPSTYLLRYSMPKMGNFQGNLGSSIQASSALVSSHGCRGQYLFSLHVNSSTHSIALEMEVVRAYTERLL